MTGEPDKGGDGAGDAAEALSIARQLHELISQILERLTDAVKYGKRTRLMSWLLVVSVVLDVALSVITIRNTHQLGRQQAALRAQQAAIHASQLHACGIGNDFRGRERRLWDHILGLSNAPPGETAAQRKVRLARSAAFRIYIGRQFRPVDCKALYRSH